jgi:hypothetical protein
MAVYKIFPSKDNTIYSGRENVNMGVDEILELSNNSSFLVEKQASRILIEFNKNQINKVVDLFPNSETNSKFEINLYNANIEGITDNFTLVANPLAKPWINGLGKANNIPGTTIGSSWVSTGTEPWLENIPSGSTSFLDTGIPDGGGVWWSGSEFESQYSFELYDSKDIKLDITNSVKAWISGSFENYGTIIRIKEENEFIPKDQQSITLNYFSRDTNTIFPPTLDIKWEDFIYQTGSLPIINSNSVYLSLDNNLGEFDEDTIHRFNINCRPKYPARVFQTSSLYTTNHYLPEDSFYGIQDTYSNDMIIDFDETYTRISADEEGSFFNIYMDGLQPERWYRVIIKSKIKGQTIVFNKDNNLLFKIRNRVSI